MAAYILLPVFYSTRSAMNTTFQGYGITGDPLSAYNNAQSILGYQPQIVLGLFVVGALAWFLLYMGRREEYSYERV